MQWDSALSYWHDASGTHSKDSSKCQYSLWKKTMSARHLVLQMWCGPLQILPLGTFLGHEVALDFSPLLSYHSRVQMPAWSSWTGDVLEPVCLHNVRAPDDLRASSASGLPFLPPSPKLDGLSLEQPGNESREEHLLEGRRMGKAAPLQGETR